MREYLNKKRLIKARKSGTYSRLLKRYKKKWQLADKNHVENEKSEPEFSEDVHIDNQPEFPGPGDLPRNMDDEIPNVSNQMAPNNSCKNTYRKLLIHLYL